MQQPFLADRLTWDNETRCSYDEAGCCINTIQAMKLVTCPECKDHQLHVLSMHKYSHHYNLGNVMKQPVCYFCHPKMVEELTGMSDQEKTSTAQKEPVVEQAKRKASWKPKQTCVSGKLSKGEKSQKHKKRKS